MTSWNCDSGSSVCACILSPSKSSVEDKAKVSDSAGMRYKDLTLNRYPISVRID